MFVLRKLKSKKKIDILQAQQEETIPEDSEFYDETIQTKQAQTRGRKQFTFVEPGKYQDLADRHRAKAKLEALQEEIATVAKKTGISSVTKLALMAPSQITEDTVVPDIEWWDATILGENYTVPDRVPEEITLLVQHPIQIEPPGARKAPVVLPVLLTKRERKKMKRQTKKATEKEKQEKIQLGLIEPAAPKVKMNNLMRVLGTEAVQEPSKVEAMVRQQMALRQQKHENDNKERALTKEERREKKIKKAQEDTSLQAHVCVYRINDLRDPKTKWKVEQNAKQLFLSGCMLMTNEELNIVVVEGGPKGMKKYKRLMMKRIKWDDAGSDDDSDDEEEGDEKKKKRNACHLVWEGSVQNRAFHTFEKRVCRTEAIARNHLADKGVGHYWDLALSDSVLEEG